MHALTNWITQIILIIMFAIVLELLLPNERFNRYVKTVIGLILILTLLSPIMKLFNMPVDSILNQMIPQQTNDPIKNSINTKKKEIESGQRAYISKQMAVQMKSYVKGALNDRYGLAIETLNLNLNYNNSNNPINHATVTLGQARSTSPSSENSKNQKVTVDPVQNVTVNSVQVGGTPSNASSDEKKAKSIANENAIRTFLSNQWNLAPNKITLHLKGGGT